MTEPHFITCRCVDCSVAAERRYYEKALSSKDLEIAKLKRKIERLTPKKKASR